MRYEEREFKHTSFFHLSITTSVTRKVSDLWSGLNILTKQPLLIECVAGLSCNGIYGALVDLLLDCTQQQEERLADCFLQKVAEDWSQKLCSLRI